MTAPTLLFACPNCLVATDDTACDCCGRALTAKDLTPSSQAAGGVPFQEPPHAAQTRSESR